MAYQPPSVRGPSRNRGFMVTLIRHNTFGRTRLDEWSVRPRNFYMTTHNTHNRQTSVAPAGFESSIPASKRPKTRTLDRAATGIDSTQLLINSIDSKTHIPDGFKANGNGKWNCKMLLFLPVKEVLTFKLSGVLAYYCTTLRVKWRYLKLPNRR